MNDITQAFVARFLPEVLDEEGRKDLLTKQDLGDAGINWWRHWLDATEGRCEIEVGAHVVELALFADFSGSLRDFPEWAERIRRDALASLEFIEQGVDYQLLFESFAKAHKLTLLDHGRKIAEIKISGDALIARWRRFFEEALEFYERQGVDCTEGRRWVEKIF